MKNVIKTHKSLIPTNKAFSKLQPIYIPVFLSDKTEKKQMLWELEFENGERLSGKVKRNAINLPAGFPTGNHKLTLVVGQNLLIQGYKLYHCDLTITS